MRGQPSIAERSQIPTPRVCGVSKSTVLEVVVAATPSGCLVVGERSAEITACLEERLVLGIDSAVHLVSAGIIPINPASLKVLDGHPPCW